MSSSQKNILVDENGNKKKIIFLFKVLIASGLLFYIVELVDLRKIKYSIETANIYLVISAFLLGAINIFFQFAKWRVICRSLLQINKNKLVLRSLFYGFAAGIASPMRIGEHFIRAIPFKNKSIVDVTIASFIDKLFPLTIAAFIGSVSSIIYIHTFYDVTLFVTLLLFLVLLLLSIILLVIIKRKNFWNNFIFQKIKNWKILYKFISKIEIVSELKKFNGGKIFLYSLFFYSTYIFQFVLLVGAFSLKFELLNYIWFATLIMFAKSIIPSFTFGELGIREGAAIFFAGAFNISQAAGFSAAFLLFIINLVLPSLVGALLLIRKSE
jgi:uncharacterized protein (TIRG00374 family)